MRVRIAVICGCLVSLGTFLARPLQAQDNYEIQVYGYETVEPRHTMVELHSNFTFQGSKTFHQSPIARNHRNHARL